MTQSGREEDPSNTNCSKEYQLPKKQGDPKSKQIIVVLVTMDCCKMMTQSEIVQAVARQTAETTTQSGRKRERYQ